MKKILLFLLPLIMLACENEIEPTKEANPLWGKWQNVEAPAHVIEFTKYFEFKASGQVIKYVLVGNHIEWSELGTKESYGISMRYETGHIYLSFRDETYIKIE